MTFWSGDAFSQLGQEGRGGLTVTQMFQDLRKMTASQHSTTHCHVVDPPPNVPALVISLFLSHQPFSSPRHDQIVQADHLT